VNGLVVARAGRGRITYGLFDSRKELTRATLPEVMALARELARLRSADAADRGHPLYQRDPESWLESVVRRDPCVIESSLRPAPLHAHPLTLAGAERAVLDLLACDRDGRLAVIELKASEDIHLPLQGLDYWLRVKWHLERGELSRQGYFPGIELSDQPPRLLLVSPALVFHPSTEIVLRYFSRQVYVERIGINTDWREGLRVLFRRRGDERAA
jgi:hypothetical protein